MTSKGSYGDREGYVYRSMGYDRFTKSCKGLSSFTPRSIVPKVMHDFARSKVATLVLDFSVMTLLGDLETCQRFLEGLG